MYMVQSHARTLQVGAGRDARAAGGVDSTPVRPKPLLGTIARSLIAKNKDGITEILGRRRHRATSWARCQPGWAGRRRRNSWEAGLSKNGFFPLRVVSKDLDGNERMRMRRWHRTEVLPDSTFAVPEDFRKFEMPSIPGLADCSAAKATDA